MSLQCITFVLNKLIKYMKAVIRNVKTDKYRVAPVYARYKKDRVEVLRTLEQSLPAHEQVVEVHLNERGK